MSFQPAHRRCPDDREAQLQPRGPAGLSLPVLAWAAVLAGQSAWQAKPTGLGENLGREVEEQAPSKPPLHVWPRQLCRENQDAHVLKGQGVL